MKQKNMQFTDMLHGPLKRRKGCFGVKETPLNEVSAGARY